MAEPAQTTDVLEVIGDEDPNREMSEEEVEAREAALSDLALVCADSRKECITGRQLVGIELEWIEDEEFYEGIDDANRGEMGAYRSKPPGQASLGDEDDEGDGNSGSTIFLNMVRAYVDAASARVGDMLLPTDDRGWQIKPTPIPDLVDIGSATLSQAVEDAILAQYQDDKLAQLLERGKKIREKFPRPVQKQIDEAFPEQMDPEANAEMKAARANTYIQLAEEVQADLDQANAKADKAQRRIEDWHVECQYHAEMRQVIDDTARIGTGVMKGPVPVRKRRVAYKDGELHVEFQLQPASMRVDPWNCYPDPGCGQSIHDGNMHWERDEITSKRLQELREQPGYIDAQIVQCLVEGPQSAIKAAQEATGKNQMLGMTRRDTKNLYEIWYGYLHLNKEQLLLAGVDPDDVDAFGDEPSLPVCVTMVNDRIIRVTLNHLDTGEFPYDYMVWQRRAAMPYGIGVARQIRTPQRIINAAARNMMDNAGLAGGPMWAFLTNVLEPLDGMYELRPRKGWAIRQDATKEELENAFKFFEMPMVQQELQAILEIGLKMAEDVTGLPMLLQGQSGSAPDTVGGMTLLNNNATAVMRRIARLFDDLITEPHVRRYYTYLLQYGDDDEKGDFQIDARGSSSLVEREVNNQAIAAMANMVTNPIFKKDPAKWMTEWMKSQHLDPKQMDYDDDDWREIVEGLAAQAQKGDSSVEVAQIRAQTDLQIQDMKGQLVIAERALDEEKQMRQEELEKAFKALEQELNELRLVSEDKWNSEKINASLQDTLLKLRAQFLMQGVEGRAPQLTEPPTEPPGRAPDGQAYQA